MVPVWYIALFLVTFCSMDPFDRPRSCPIVEGQPLRWSVGYYRNRRRFTLAWFADFDAACRYLQSVSASYPRFKIDLLQSLF